MRLHICVAQEDARFEQVTDVRAQLKFFEQLDQREKQKKEEQEREILMKAAKVKHTHSFLQEQQMCISWRHTSSLFIFVYVTCQFIRYPCVKVNESEQILKIQCILFHLKNN